MAGRDTPWRIHAVLSRSVANGPGERFTIWSQGCMLACPGCFNPDTHASAGGTVTTAGEMVDAALAELPGIEGVTLTGGEPLEQPEAVAAFCGELRTRADLSVIVLTGFTRAEIESDAALSAAVDEVDLVIAGRFNQRRPLAFGLRGSANKAYWAVTGRYGPGELEDVPDLEVVIGTDGFLVATGMAAPQERLL